MAVSSQRTEQASAEAGGAPRDESLTEEALREGFTAREQLRDQFSDSNRIVRTVRLIGGAMIGVIAAVLLLVELGVL